MNGRGPITPVRGQQLTMVIYHLLNGMIGFLTKDVSCHPGGDEPASWVGGSSNVYMCVVLQMQLWEYYFGGCSILHPCKVFLVCFYPAFVC